MYDWCDTEWAYIHVTCINACLRIWYFTWVDNIEYAYLLMNIH